MSVPAERAGPRATPRDWLGLAVLALPCLLATMDLEVLNLAVPALSAALRPSGTELLWIVDSYGFLIAGSLVTMGTLGDRIGRRRLLLIGAAAFGATSVLAAYAGSAEVLIGARALLGVAGATLAPSTLSLIRGMFLDPGQRTVAVSIWATSFSAGAAVGPVLGGVLLRYFWWGSVFLLAVPVMVLLLVLGPVLLPEFRDPDARPLDLASAALSLVAVLALVYGLKRFAADGPDRWAALAALGGVLVGALFLRRQRRLASPLLDPALFRVPAFSGALAAFTLSLFAGYGMFFLIAQYLQLVLGLSPLVAGLWSLPAAAGLVTGSLLAPALARLARPAYVMAAGLAASTVGFGVLACAGAGGGLLVPVLGSTIFAAGIAPVGTLATDLVVGAAPVERAGAAAAISETAAELGGSLGIAVLGSLGTAVYRRQLSGALPADVPADAADAARDTLGAAVAAATTLPARVGTAVLELARAAFTVGFQFAAVAAALTAALLAVVTAALLRQVPRAGAADAATGE